MENTTITEPKIKMEEIRHEVNKNIPRKDYYSADELLALEIKEVPHVIESLIPTEGVVAIAGSSDTGKSSLLRQMAIQVATGEKEFLGFSINAKYNSVIYVSTEDLKESMSALLQKNKLRFRKESFGNLQFIFNTESLIQKLDSMLSKGAVDLVVIDAFGDLYDKNLNESTQVRAFLQGYCDLAEKYSCAIIFLHHCGKHTENKPPSKNNLLGSQGFEAKMRVVIELRTDPENPYRKHLCIVKGNYLSAKYKNDSFELDFDEPSLTFRLTGQRVPFHSLIPRDLNDQSHLKTRAKQLKSQGKTQKDIAEELGVNQATISRWLSK